MGDSFASGEGAANGSYVPGTDTPGVNTCHRSYASYADQYTSGSSRWQSVTNMACSGAETGDILSGAVDGKSVGGNPAQGEPAQVDPLDDNTLLVTIMVGGNNTDLFDIAKNCYFKVDATDIDACFSASVNSALYTQIGNLEGTLAFIYERIEASAPNATLEVLTYPQIYPDPTTYDPHVDDGCDGAPVTIITSKNQLTLIHGVIDWLDDVIRQAAADAGARVIDLENAFAGHELCAPGSYVNQVVGSNLLDPAPESFHPNIAGYAREAALIKNTLDALS